MATEFGKLINAEPLYLDNGTRSTWDGKFGFFYAWQLEVEMGGEIVYLKAFSKSEDKYSLANETEISFMTDWDESKGLPYAKKIKDVNKEDNYSNRGGGRPQGRPQSSGRPTSRPASRPSTPAPAPKPTGLSSSTVLYQMQAAALKYLEVASKQKQIDLNMTTIKEIGMSYHAWAMEFEDKATAIKAMNLAIDTAKLNECLVSNEATINNSKELKAVAALYYDFLKQ